MHPTPEDAGTVEQMRTAHRLACTALGVRLAPDAQEAWGWRGRTLSQPVTATDCPAWLRLACSPSGQIAHTFWDGSLDAEKAIPTTIPRPRLREHHDWSEPAWEYRAELYDRITVQPIAQSALLKSTPGLPPDWWAALRTALGTIATVPTHRHTTEQQYLDWAMPTFLGATLDTSVSTWTTAHGDLHWANLCAPRLQILDWEGWGLAPIGYDAAMLHSYSLLVPDVAARVHTELADSLQTPTGRFAELVTIAELLHNAAQGNDIGATASLRQRAAHVLLHSTSR
ncbi:MAG: hypothetical protein ACR2GH_09785 [Pseudonocardia sp.]